LPAELDQCFAQLFMKDELDDIRGSNERIASEMESRTVESARSNLTYEAGSNRLQRLTGALPANYALGSGGWTLTYNLANRMVAALANGIPAAAYRINALQPQDNKNRTMDYVATIVMP